MEQIERIKLEVNSPLNVKVDDEFSRGYAAGWKNLQVIIRDILNTKEPKGISLWHFLETEKGFAMWDSHELNIVFRGEIIFKVVENYKIVIDKENFKFVKKGELTERLKDFYVAKTVKVEDVNYIIIEEN